MKTFIALVLFCAGSVASAESVFQTYCRLTREAAAPC